MTVDKKDLIIIEKTKELEIISEFLAKRRLFFEYPRQGYGGYDESHISKIKSGILGELAFFEYIYSWLEEQYGSLDSKQRWKILHKKVGFSYLLVLGKFDGGHEFEIGVKDPILIDIKTYEENKVSVSQIFNGLKDDKKNPRPLNLFVDKTQNAKADIYVQTFILKNGNIVLAGFNQGLPPIKNWMPKPAHTKPVPNLQPMNNLKNLIIDRME